MNSKLEILASLTGKNIDLVKWKCFAHSLETFSTKNLSSKPKEVGKWLQQLICLVPIQIARADGNKFHGKQSYCILTESTMRWTLYKFGKAQGFK